jgi:cation diffusion facilitator family transporter
MGCGCEAPNVQTEAEKRVLRIALGLNATMFVVGLIAGFVAQSSGLIADSLDMLADATAYSIALIAIRRGAIFKARAAGFSGVVLSVLGAGVLIDVARRGFLGRSPESTVMLGVATLSLLVNSFVLISLGRFRRGEVHLRATWIFTRVDVIANVAVIASGLIVLLTAFRFADLIVGALIGLYVLKEAIEILREAKGALATARKA